MTENSNVILFPTNERDRTFVVLNGETFSSISDAEVYVVSRKGMTQLNEIEEIKFVDDEHIEKISIAELFEFWKTLRGTT